MSWKVKHVNGRFMIYDEPHGFEVFEDNLKRGSFATLVEAKAFVQGWEAATLVAALRSKQ